MTSALLFVLWGVLPQANFEDAVVRVQVYRSRPDWANPWRDFPVEGSLGSGFVIDKGLVITNAHVVRDARQVLVRKNNVADPFVATVLHHGDDCDLAVLQVADPAFAKGIRPLRLGRVPKARSQVTTYGFPLGGEQVSSTGGIVSRVEWTGYSHSGADAHLAVQTDAAINPGNSGGPVIQDGRVVGVAFQGFAGLDNVGFFIPVPVIQHFLKDIADGTYDGFPDGGAKVAPMTSPALRHERGVPPNRAGVVVQAVEPGGSMEGVLQAGDVLLAVEGVALDDEGNIALGDGRVPYGHLLDAKQVGQPFTLTVWRDGGLVSVKGTARRMARADILRNLHNVKPRYLVHAGLVFMPLNMEYLKTLGREWRSTAPRELMWHMFFRAAEQPQEADREVVVVARVLRHPINSRMRISTGDVVSRVNGQAISSLKDLADVLDHSTATEDVLELGADGDMEAVNRAQAAAVRANIMRAYGIPRERNL